jgi:hypothetical protein
MIGKIQRARTEFIFFGGVLAVILKYSPPGCLGMVFYTYLLFLAGEMDRVLVRIARKDVQGECDPKLNPKKNSSEWLNKPGSPKAKVNEKPKGETVNYDDLIQAWCEVRVK